MTSFTVNVLELCCFEWSQNIANDDFGLMLRFRAVLFRMVPKPFLCKYFGLFCFRAVLFRMVPKPNMKIVGATEGFRAVLFRMVPKLVMISMTCL